MGTKLKSTIPYSKSLDVIKCLPTAKHAMKGLESSASIKTFDIMGYHEGIFKTVEVWDLVERKMYVFRASDVMKPGVLYYCGDSDYMAFKYKLLTPKEIR